MWILTPICFHNSLKINVREKSPKIFHKNSRKKGYEILINANLNIFWPHCGEEQSGWSQSGKKGGKESAILTHVISGLFKSPRLVSSRSQSAYRMTPSAVAQEKL